MLGPSPEVDAYFENLGPHQRIALENLRAAIRDAAPEAEECVSYSLPAFRREGKTLVAYGAAKNHCALYPLSPAVLAAHQDELAEFETSKGTIRFHPEHPLPPSLVQSIVAARVAETSA